MGRVRSKLSFANVTSALALFLALGGASAIALTGRNTVESNDIIRGNVRKSDIARNAVGTAKIVNGGVAGKDLANAIRPRVLIFKTLKDSAELPVVTIGDMTMRAHCRSSLGRTDLLVTMESDGVGGVEDQAVIVQNSNGPGDGTFANEADVAANGSPTEIGEVLPTAGERQQLGGLWTYFNNQRTVNLQMHLIADDAGAGRCFIRGIAATVPSQ
jgi:hypothetical protein